MEAYFQQNKVSQALNHDENIDFGSKSIGFHHFGVCWATMSVFF